MSIAREEYLIRKLMARAKAAKQEADGSTKSLLKTPDAAVVKALEIAQRAI